MIDNIIPAHVPEALIAICGDRYVVTDTDLLYAYGKDQTLDLHFPFDILVKPGTPAEIAAIMKLANQHRIPVTPRGGGSGVTGGALPVKRGIVLSLERLDRIVGVHPADSYIVAESGAITEEVCKAAAAHGLYFPVAPSSAAYSFVGGNVAENAGSIYSCRYGTTSHYVLNLEVVLPSGDIIWTGANVMKNATGLNLTQLFTGSEGTLGIITKVVYRLLPAPLHETSLLAAFNSTEAACSALAAIKQSVVQPAAAELIGRRALEVTAAFLPGPLPLVNDHVQAHVLLHLQENSEAAMWEAIEKTAAILEPYTTEEILTGSSASERERLWQVRFNIGAALTAGNRRYRDIDIAVPLSGLYDYIQEVEKICAAHQVPVASFGHALDGNLHTMLQLDAQQNAEEDDRVEQAVQAIYAYAIRNGGVISGEHGIGLIQQPLMNLQFTAPHLALMQGIKQLFDPNGILNPGKIFQL